MGNVDNYDAVERLQLNDLDKRRVYIWGEISGEMSVVVISQLHYLSEKNNKPIYLMIHSNGGAVTDCEAIIDTIQMCQAKGIKIYTIGVGECYSAAAVILAMGTKKCRLLRPNSTIMLHPVSYGVSTDYNVYQERATKFYKDRVKTMDKYLCDAIGISDGKEKSKFLSEMSKSLWFNADQAIARGLADKIYRGEINGDNLK